jgi:hypothetical protein
MNSLYYKQSERVLQTAVKVCPMVKLLLRLRGSKIVQTT